jgi:hypothetical protein
MTGYVRKDTTNNIADGNVINASDLDAEFDGVKDAFQASTGHKHDGSTGEGAPITSLGPNQDVTISATLLAPKTTNTVDIGSSALKFKDLFLAGNGSVGGTLAVTGVATLTANPVLSAGTANGVAYLNGSKVVTSGSALQFDGTNLGLGVTPSTLDIGRTIQVGFNSNTIWGATANNFQFLAGATYNNAYLYAVTGAAVSNYRQNAGQHQWYNAPSGTAGNAITFTQAMTLNSGGYLGVGVTSPSARVHAVGSGVDQAEIQAENTSTTSGARALVRVKSASSTYGGGLMISNATDATYPTNSLLLYNFDSQPIVFGTNNAERARITSDGVVLVGLTSAFNGTTSPLQVSNSANNQVLSIRNTHASSPYGQYINYSAAAPNTDGFEFIYCNDTGGLRMSARSNGGIANYSGNNSNLSDRREKTNFAPAKSYLDVICAIPVQTFNYIDQNMEEDGGLTLGVVAQDVQAVAPELVMESNWASKDEAPKMRLSIYQTDLQYALMKALQELKAEFDAYKASHP